MNILDPIIPPVPLEDADRDFPWMVMIPGGFLKWYPQIIPFLYIIIYHIMDDN